MALAFSTAAVGQAPDYTGDRGLLYGMDENSMDAARDQIIHRYRRSPHATRYEPDVSRLRAAATRDIVIQQQRFPEPVSEAEVQLFYPAGASLRTVVKTLAGSLGYDWRFVSRKDADISVPTQLRGAVSLTDAVGWLSERVGRQIVVYPESRLVMVMHGDFHE
ncbi:MAG: hypothetical protein RLO53_13645 [Salinisphaeraceae bacterium]